MKIALVVLFILYLIFNVISFVAYLKGDNEGLILPLVTVLTLLCVFMCCFVPPMITVYTILFIATLMVGCC